MVSIWAEVMIPAGDGAGQTISTVPEAPGTGGCSGSSASLSSDGSCLFWAYYLKIQETP